MGKGRHSMVSREAALSLGLHAWQPLLEMERHQLDQGWRLPLYTNHV